MDSERILSFVRMKGPVVPVEVASSLKINSMFASAFLSELLSAGKLKLTHMKVGRSKLYFIPGQENQLVNFIKNLNEKDRQTCEFLEIEKVIRDKSTDPLTRVSLRNIPDFAVPLEVDLNGDKELFWKWFLLPNEELESLIKKSLGINEDEVNLNDPEEINVEEKVDTEKLKEEAKEVIKEIKGTVKEDDSEKLEKEISDVKKEAEKIIEETKEEFIEPVDDEAREKNETGDVKNEELTNNFEDSKSVGISDKEEVQGNLSDKFVVKDEQKRLVDKLNLNDEFAMQLQDYFNENHIEIITYDIIKKKTEVDFEIMLPSPVGRIRFFCKGRKKKTISDGDLASAFVTGQMKKLPVLFITTGKLTKKAEAKLVKEMPSVTIKKVDFGE